MKQVVFYAGQPRLLKENIKSLINFQSKTIENSSVFFLWDNYQLSEKFEHELRQNIDNCIILQIKSNGFSLNEIYPWIKEDAPEFVRSNLIQTYLFQQIINYISENKNNFSDKTVFVKSRSDVFVPKSYSINISDALKKNIVGYPKFGIGVCDYILYSNSADDFCSMLDMAYLIEALSINNIYLPPEIVLALNCQSKNIKLNSCPWVPNQLLSAGKNGEVQFRTTKYVESGGLYYGFEGSAIECKYNNGLTLKYMFNRLLMYIESLRYRGF